MLYRLIIKLTSPLLGANKCETAVRKFCREGPAVLQIDGEKWEWLLDNARTALHKPSICIACICSPKSTKLPSISVYRRNGNLPSGAKFTDMFECAKTGTILALEFAVTTKAKDVPADMTVPTEGELAQMMKYIGDHLGISPFGSHRGYGRFEIKSIQSV